MTNAQWPKLHEAPVVTLKDGFPIMEGLIQNLRYTFRTLRESLGVTATILLTIALGIGANTAIFTVDYATLIAPSPYPHPDRLVNVWSKIQGHRNFVSAGDFADWKRRPLFSSN